MRRKGLSILGSIGLALAVVPLLAATPASADRRLTGSGCKGVLAIFFLPVENVLPLVDAPYRSLVAQNAGNAQVFVGTAACDAITVHPRTANPGAYAVAGVGIEAPDSSAGMHFYLMSWVSDNRDYAAWLRDGTNFGSRVAAVKRGLTHSLRSTSPGSFSWRFAVPVRRADPFTMRATAGKALAQPGTFAVFWRDTSAGTVRIQTIPETERFGSASGTLTAVGHSDLARMFGAESTRSFDVGLSLDLAKGSLMKQVMPQQAQVKAPRG